MEGAGALLCASASLEECRHRRGKSRTAARARTKRSNGAVVRMHALSLLSDGFFLSLSLCLDIGLVNVAIISLTLSHGFKPGFWLGLGSCFGDLVYASLALAGMAALLQFESVRWIVWIGGAPILLFLTWKMAGEALFPASAPPAEGEAEANSPHLNARRGFLR